LLLTDDPVNHVIIHREAFGGFEIAPVPPDLHGSPFDVARKRLGALAKILKRHPLLPASRSLGSIAIKELISKPVILKKQNINN
jgi:hypothetical protein